MEAWPRDARSRAANSDCGEYAAARGRLRFQLNGAGEFRFGRFRRNQTLNFIKSDCRFTWGSIFDSGYVLWRDRCRVFRSDQTCHIHIGNIGINYYSRIRLRRVCVIRRVHDKIVVAARV